MPGMTNQRKAMIVALAAILVLLSAGGAWYWQRLTQRGPRVVLVQLGPEQAEQRIAPMEAVRRREGKVGEESDALRP